MLKKNIHTIGFTLDDNILDKENLIPALFQIESLKLFKKAGHTIWILTDKKSKAAELITKLNLANKVDTIVGIESKEKPDILFQRDGLVVFDEDKEIVVKSAAFDMRGTLLGAKSFDVVNLLKYLKSIGIKTIVWTEEDRVDATNAAKVLGIEGYVDEYETKFRKELADIVFDDNEQAILLGKLATIKI